MRLDLRDVRLHLDAECEKHKRPEELKVDERMGEAEGAGGKVAGDLLVNEDNIVDAETFEEETSDANREDADKERDEGKRKMDSGERRRTRITSFDDCSCWRLKRNSWTSFLKGASTVRPDTIGIVFSALWSSDQQRKKAARLTPLVSSMRCRVQVRVLMMRMQRWSAGE